MYLKSSQVNVRLIYLSNKNSNKVNSEMQLNTSVVKKNSQFFFKKLQITSIPSNLAESEIHSPKNK